MKIDKTSKTRNGIRSQNAAIQNLEYTFIKSSDEAY